MSTATDTVRTVPVPTGSLISNTFAVTHFADAFEMTLPPGAPESIDALARVFERSSPRWIDVLMQLRNRAVSLIGFKTSLPPALRPQSDAPLAPGDRAAIFLVFARTNDEILMGLDDKHLNFRVSLLRAVSGDAPTLTVTTIVHFNNWIGRAYFLPVRPIHHLLIVPAAMRAMRTTLIAEASARLEHARANR